MLDRIRERRVGQWTGAYIAAAWVLVEVVDVVAQWWSWSAAVVRAIQVLLALGLPFVVTLAWYHGEKGRQRFSTPEILIIVLLSLIAAAVIRGLGPRLTQTASGRMADSTATTADDGPSAPPTPSIAVLPFGNLSPDPENAFFADGLHDEILVTLDRIEPLRVISRTSVLGYRDTPKSVQTIARELGISHLLEGTVRKTRDQLRITAQLIDASTDDHLWSETFDRPYSVEDVYTIQGELARRIVGSLRLELAPEVVTRITTPPTAIEDAYAAYLAGQVHAHQALVLAEAEAAISEFERAVELDPRYADAWVELVYLRGLMAWNYGRPEQIPQAREALATLEALGPDLEETHFARGYFRYYAVGDFERALDAFEVVRQRRGLDGRLAFPMAAMLRRMGRWNEAVAVGLEGLAVDPRNANLHAVVGRALLRMRRFDQAERYTRQAMELSPGVPVFFGDLVRIALWGRGDTATARTWVADGKDQTTVVQNRFTAMEAELAWWRRRPEALELFRDAGSSDLVALIHRREGRPEEARGIGETILQDATRRLVVLETHQVQPAVQRVRVDRAFAMTLLDRRDDALSELERALDPGWLDSFSSPAVEAALAYTELGRPEEAIDILARLLAEPSELTVARLRLDPRWDPLRDESAFQALVEGRPPSGG